MRGLVHSVVDARREYCSTKNVERVSKKSISVTENAHEIFTFVVNYWNSHKIYAWFHNKNGTNYVTSSHAFYYRVMEYIIWVYRWMWMTYQNIICSNLCILDAFPAPHEDYFIWLMKLLTSKYYPYFVLTLEKYEYFRITTKPTKPIQTESRGMFTLAKLLGWMCCAIAHVHGYDAKKTLDSAVIKIMIIYCLAKLRTIYEACTCKSINSLSKWAEKSIFNTLLYHESY